MTRKGLPSAITPPAHKTSGLPDFRTRGNLRTMLPYTATAVAEALYQTLDRAAATRGRATLAIPGGRSPGPVLTELAAMVDPFLRARLHLLWLDERAVPVGHADRNDAPTLAAWQAGGALPAHVHPMPAEDADLEAAALRYADTLAAATAGSALDAALVGMGEDGHIASLFPNHAGLKDVASVFAIYDSPKPPPRRLTLSLGVIRDTGLLIVLALGEAKRALAQRAQAGTDQSLPVSLLPRERTVWFGE